MMGEPLLWLGDALVILGLGVTTIAVYGLARMPDPYARLHAASKAAVLGVIPVLVATAVAVPEGAVLAKSLLIAAFLLLTTPISAYAIGNAAFRGRQRMATPGAVDESGRNLAPGEPERSRDGRRHG